MNAEKQKKGGWCKVGIMEGIVVGGIIVMGSLLFVCGTVLLGLLVLG